MAELRIMAMALRKLVAGNWKMNGNMAVLQELDAIAAAAQSNPGVDVAICPPATLITPAVARAPSLAIGGQDCHWNDSGAHTGCLSTDMLWEAGAKLVIVGHSERRTDNFETDADVKRKASKAMAGRMRAIVCVGETETQRDQGCAVEVVTEQVAGSVPDDAHSGQLVVAYEPVWAIGTGRTPTVPEIAEIHAAIRSRLLEMLGADGEQVQILYGGSVKPSNAAELLHIPNVDGALVGGASLSASDFVPIIEAANAPS
jgi:triosephosphate isomerase (TIM)